ncbi:MAG: hypothetical protein MUF16_07565 [Burkholderiaceae bacterium]|nr:hypothetical protein [Burkholderiaceae bacterium]
MHAVRTALLDWGYTTDMLGLAIIGCAGSAWCMGANPSRRRFDSLPWILQSDAHIDRLMDDGERALEWARRQASGSRSSSSSSSLKLVPNGPSDEQRARLAELRRQLAARVAQR